MCVATTLYNRRADVDDPVRISTMESIKNYLVESSNLAHDEQLWLSFVIAAAVNYHLY